MARDNRNVITFLPLDNRSFLDIRDVKTPSSEWPPDQDFGVDISLVTLASALALTI